MACWGWHTRTTLLPVHGRKSDREEHLIHFWEEVHRAAGCITAYQAGTVPARMLKHSNITGKTTTEKRKSAAQLLVLLLKNKLHHECYPNGLLRGAKRHRRDGQRRVELGLPFFARSDVPSVSVAHKVPPMRSSGMQ